MSDSLRVAIIGFGFSGLMVTANLVRQFTTPATLYIISPEGQDFGLAYGTTDPQHLLNVPTVKMGAYADAADGFYGWLNGYEGAAAKQRLGLKDTYGANDFAPRMLYAAYLQSVWAETQQLAAQKNIALKHVPSCATCITPGTPLRVLTERGDAIAADRAVLATGHEVTAILPQLDAVAVIQNPWAFGALKDAASWASPVALMGTGLTAIDTVMSLRRAGYEGQIVAFGRHGLLPQPHAATAPYEFDRAALGAALSLNIIVRHVAAAIRTHGNWRGVVDALRPHTQAWWQKLSLRDQQRFLTRLASFWSVHRHRMAPAIAGAMRAEIQAGTLRIIGSPRYEAAVLDGKPTLVFHTKAGKETVCPSRIINCTGPQLHLARSRRMLIKQALADGVIEPHATGIGLAADPHYRAWGNAYPRLSVIGPLLTGQLLESTAVPELREQASAIANRIVQRLPPPA